MLVEELREIGISPAHATAGGVHFSANWLDVYRNQPALADRESRASVRIVQGRYRDEADIHRLAQRRRTGCAGSRSAQTAARRHDRGQRQEQEAPFEEPRVSSRCASRDGICDRFPRCGRPNDRASTRARPRRARVSRTSMRTPARCISTPRANRCSSAGWRSEAGECAAAREPRGRHPPARGMEARHGAC